MPAFYIVLQEKIPGVDALSLEGRAVSKHSDKLEMLAKQAGVKPVTSFFSVNRDEALGLLGVNEASRPDIPIPDEQWFTPEEGLLTVDALLKTLAGEPSAENSALARELAEFQQVLQAARSRNIRWHLAIDY